MDYWLSAASIGVSLLTISGAFLRYNYRDWQRQKNSGGNDAKERIYFYKRYRRRMQMSVMIALQGLLLPIGLLNIAWEKQPLLFVIYWLLVPTFICWMIILAFGDLYIASIRAKKVIRQLSEKEDELKKQLSQIQKRGSSQE